MNRVLICESLLKRNETEPFWKKLITGGKKWTRTCKKIIVKRQANLTAVAPASIRANDKSRAVKQHQLCSYGAAEYDSRHGTVPVRPPRGVLVRCPVAAVDVINSRRQPLKLVNEPINCKYIIVCASDVIARARPSTWRKSR
ncbi:hypothetical protein EVAR_9115_1 [Eumeta japonica]|uniref:Uncharacterized protein n=1 Tax=Eumeta variegata TaxID=151549 RepID=A0A4C1TW55_EUMVA|nr:hypothetical protein EVAR_9115_1 [Eumeta japonica]